MGHKFGKQASHLSSIRYKWFSTLLHVKSDLRLSVGKDRGKKPLAPAFRPTGTCWAPGCLSQKEQLRKDPTLPSLFREDGFMKTPLTEWHPAKWCWHSCCNQPSNPNPTGFFQLLVVFHQGHLIISRSPFLYSFALFLSLFCCTVSLYLMYPNKDAQILLHWYQV